MASMYLVSNTLKFLRRSGSMVRDIKWHDIKGTVYTPSKASDDEDYTVSLVCTLGLTKVRGNVANGCTLIALFYGVVVGYLGCEKLWQGD